MTVKKQARNDKRKQKKCCGMTGRRKRGGMTGRKKMRDDRKRGGYDDVKMTATDRGKHNRVEKVRRTTRNKNIKERRKNIFYYFLS